MKIKIVIICIIISMMFTGCMEQNPSDAVMNFFYDIKSGDIKSIDYSLEEISLLKQSNENLSKDLIDCILKSFNHIDVYVMRETIKEDSGEVIVQVDGIDVNKIINEVCTKELGQTYLKSKTIDSKTEDEIINKINKAKPTTRSGYVNVIKVNGVWEIEYDINTFELIFGEIPS